MLLEVENVSKSFGVVETIWLQYQDGRPELVFPLEFATADLIYPAPPFDER
jgi:hypothetical protein